MGIGRAVACLIMIAGIAACTADQRTETSVFDPREQRERDLYGTVTGNDGVSVFGTDKDDGDANAGAGIGVNAFLWQASLETFDFIPIASADPFGGLIITDWYQPSSSPGERLKLQIFIRDASLRADGVKVSLFRQTNSVAGVWLDAPVDPATITELEDKVLTRARELRIERKDAGV